MRTVFLPRKWRLAVLAGAVAAACAAQAQSPTPTMRPIGETPYPVAPATPAATVSPEELHAIAVDAYIYAYPMVLMELTRRDATSVQSAIDGRAPMNQFGHKTVFPDAHTSNVRWPSTDTLYSSLWYDVSTRPLVIQVPDAGDRYYVLSLMDMWTDVFASRGTRTDGNRPQTFAIVGPYWQGVLPPSVDIVRSPTSMGWILGHIQTRGVNDYAAVNQFQAGLAATPAVAPPPPVTPRLGPVPPSIGLPPPPPPVAAPAYSPGTPRVSPVDQIAGMDAATFFGIFNQALRENPPHFNDYPMLDRLRKIGLVASRPVVFNQLDPAVQQALAQAGPEAGRRIADAAGHLDRGTNGWNIVTHGIGTYGADYTRRAAIAYAGLGVGVPEDVMYPLAMVDSKDRPLVGTEDYVLHFDKGQLPPVNAFWSIMLYGQNQAFVDNPINKYAVRSTDDLKYNADGSLDIYIQHRAPARDKQSNWLPAPADGQVLLNMRLYWPKDLARTGDWAPPPVVRD